MTDAYDGNLFRLERMMARVWRLNVMTARRDDCAAFYLGHWTLRLEADDIDDLVDYLDSEHAFREKADALLDRCMRLAEVRQEFKPR